MSGGAFSYAYSKVSEHLGDAAALLNPAVEFLREKGKTEAADAVARLQAAIRGVRMDAEAMSELLHAAEWWASCDWGEDRFDETWAKYRRPGGG